MRHKYLIMVGDGMADFPIPALGGKTPLEYANTPNMDAVASRGCAGLLATIPAGFLPGSDVGNMSLLGYDPNKYFCGRAPIEAASMGVPLKEGDVAFRCNLVSIDNGVMKDYSAGHISTPVAQKIIRVLQNELGDDVIEFHPGVSYRHLLIVKNIGAKLECTAPHDITGQGIDPYLPKGDGRDFILSIMDRAREVIKDTNIADCLATDIWLWGQGPAIVLPSLSDRYGLQGAVISAVDLVRGLGKLAGLTIKYVDGATGYLGTNYAGKVAAAKKAFEDEGASFVFLHIEAPDETSHEGDLHKKIQAIEEFDKYVVGEMLAYQSAHPNIRIAVTPDHVTALSTKTHDASPVPFCICGNGVVVDNVAVYNEKAVAGFIPVSGEDFFDRFIREGL